MKKGKKMDTELQSEVIEKRELDLKAPKMWEVRLHNDDYTPMDFVVLVLKLIFNKSEPEAEKIMLRIHKSDSEVIGLYTYEVAETKVMQTKFLNEKYEYSLKCTMEEEK